MGDELNIEEHLEEDWLDARLREEAPYLDEAGFVSRVISKLPARRRRLASLRAVILLGVTLFACVLAYFVSGGGEIFANFAAFLAKMPFNTICFIAGCCALVVTLLGASAAVVGAREQRTFRDAARGL